MLNALHLFTEVRGDERRETAFAFLVLFGIMSAHALQETARDALFLAKLPPTRLAWVYLSVALVALGVWLAQQRQQRAGRAALSLWLLLSGLVTFGFWALVGQAGPWVLYALYTWTGVFVTLVVVRFWSLLGDLFTVSQAKRLYALIGAGSVLGALFGSLVARTLSMSLEPRHLLLATTGLLFLTALLVHLLPTSAVPAPATAFRRQAAELEAVDLARPFRAVWQRPYLRRVAGMVLVSTVCLTLVDYVFKSIVARNVPPQELAAFFSSVYVVLNALALLAQLFLVSWLVRWLAVDRVLSVLPAGFVLAAAGVLAFGSLVSALLLKGLDGMLRHSLHRTATEVLYVPLTGELRARVKGFIDVLGQRGGQALASIVILVAASAGGGDAAVAALLLLLALVWIRIASTLGKHYLDLFRETLSQVALQSHIDFPEMDLGSLETLMAGLNSANDREVIASLDLLAEQERARLIPALILYHPSSAVVVRALEVLARAGRTDFSGIIERLYDHIDPEVRAAALRARAWTEAPSAELYERFANDTSPIVRATALVGLVSYAGSKPAAVILGRLASGGSSGEKLAVARAIGYSPGAGYDDLLLHLARSPEVNVRFETIRAMREIRSGRFIEPLIDMLGVRQLRREAHATLLAIGPDAFDALDAQLGNGAFDESIRRQIPRALAAFEPERAAACLLRHLLAEPDGGVRYRILRALGRVRADNPSVALDTGALEEVLRRTVGGVYAVIGWRRTMLDGGEADPSRRTDVQDLILALLRHKEALATERLFRLIGLLNPEEDLRSMYRGIRSANKALRASSMELLQHVLEPPLRDPVLALVDDVGDNERLRRAGPFAPSQKQSYPELLSQLLEKGGVGMRCLVVYHIGELRLGALREQIAMLPSDLGGLVTRAVNRTLALLDAAS